MLVESLLIVGHGSMGRRHLRLARELLPSARIWVLRHQLCDSIPEDADGCFNSLEEALAYSPQAAVIASPSTHHMQTAQPLADNGVHLLVEKPIANSLEGMEKLLSTCATHKIVLMTGYNLRFLPSLQEYRRLIKCGRIGKVISVRSEIGQYLPSWRPSSDYRQSVSALRALGGGVLLELSHEIDYLRWIFGEVEWVQASLSKQSSLEIDVEDTAHLVLGFSSDNEGRKLIGSLNMDFIRPDATRQCVAIGEQGSLRWNGLTGIIEMFPVGGVEWETVFIHMPERDESYKSELQHFFECIRTAKEPIVGGWDGIAALRIIEAARQSVAEFSGTPVSRQPE